MTLKTCLSSRDLVTLCTNLSTRVDIQKSRRYHTPLVLEDYHRSIEITPRLSPPAATTNLKMSPVNAAVVCLAYSMGNRKANTNANTFSVCPPTYMKPTSLPQAHQTSKPSTHHGLLNFPTKMCQLPHNHKPQTLRQMPARMVLQPHLPKDSLETAQEILQ
jgi:hypothetical protein